MLENIEVVVCKNHEEAEVIRLVARKEEVIALGQLEETHLLTHDG